ncbi:MAG: ATP-binding protein [bacterium]|jgi:two-component system phosphate regulon sensor histidine kinase PhoR|nr:ATP-binding protein [bacterium]
MRKKRLLWQIFPPFLIITLLALLAITWYATNSLRDFYFEQTKQSLIARALMIREMIRPIDPLADPQSVNRICKQIGKESGTRVTVVMRTGLVIGESDEDPQEMDDHSTRPEIEAALLGRIQSAKRFSPTLQEWMMYLAVPLEWEGEVVGAVRTAIPVTAIAQALGDVHVRIAWAGVVIALVAAGISLVISRRISRPLEEMKNVAVQFAQGRLDQRIPVLNSEEIGDLAEAMNLMATQLSDRIQTIIHQKKQQEAVLSSMVEGVLAIDQDERIITLNHAIKRLFGIEREDYVGMSLQGVIRNKDLNQFIEKAMRASSPVEGEITISSNGNQFLQAHGTVLLNEEGRKVGVVVALNDVTRLRMLENLRQEFVANVSHELRTPITAIKGFVETLLDDEQMEPSQAEKFLRITLKHVDRLNAIIEDLLSLSRIEQKESKERIETREEAILPRLLSVVEICEPKARGKKIDVRIDCDPALKVVINAPLVEQALVNLMDNAIQYSEEGSTVWIKAEVTGGQLSLHVIDEGCGIEEEHLPRIFERFYRVDKARSRKLGGTGLGLAIVKHIARVHGGEVSVKSQSGQGSTFSIHLPAS